MNTDNMIFVFGSNLSGFHGLGAAKWAYMNKGAIWGLGEGLMGTSYALPTKGYKISFMPLDIIALYVNKFIQFAKVNPDKKFQVTKVGCGLSGFTNKQIAPMFIGSPKNCYFDSDWRKYLGDDYDYWGSI